MFVRIIRPGIERLVECDSYDIEHCRSDKPEEPDYIVMELQPNRGVFSVNKVPTSEIYIMNNQGQTIDRYRW